MRRKRKDLVNKRYGKLLLLSYVRPGGPGAGAIWAALCDCGKTAEVIGKDVAAGKKKTCGSCQNGLGNPPPLASGIPAGHILYFRRLVREARNMGKMTVTAQDYNKIRALRCITCRRTDTHVEWAEYLGDPAPTNLVSLCLRCSGYRNKQNLLEWLKWLVEVGGKLTAGLQAVDISSGV